MSGIFLSVGTAVLLRATPGGRMLVSGLIGVMAADGVTQALDNALVTTVDRDVQAALATTRIRDARTYDQLLDSAPQSEERETMLGAVMMNLDYGDELRSREDASPDATAQLAAYRHRLGERLLTIDVAAAPFVHLSDMTQDELHEVIAASKNGLDGALVVGQILDDGRSSLYALAEALADITDRLTVQLGERAEADVAPDGVDGLGRVLEVDADTLLSDGTILDGRGTVVAEHTARLLGPQDQVLYVTDHGRIYDQGGVVVGEHTATLDQLSDDIVELESSYADLLNRESFIEGLVFEALPPAAKIRALKNPAFIPAGLNPAKRQELLERLEIQEDVAELVGTTADYHSLAASSLNILATTGIVPAENASVARSVVDLTASAVVTAASVYTGNVFGVMAGVSSMLTSGVRAFGSGEPGRSTDEMLLAGQRDILDGLRVVHGEVVETGRQLRRRIVALEEAVVGGLYDLGASIGGVQAEVAQARLAVERYSELQNSLWACHDFLDRRTRVLYGGFERDRSVPTGCVIRGW